MLLWVGFSLLFAFPCSCLRVGVGEYHPEYGTYIGTFNNLFHDVVGDVYAVDNITIYIRGFNYDGEAPDAYFFAGNNSPKPTNRGFVIADEKGGLDPLGPYKNRNLVIKFPITKQKGQRSFNDVKWISVWCRRFSIDFGHVILPKNLKIPNPTSAGELKSDIPALKAANVRLDDTETIKLQDFVYDGSVQDAIFVMGGGEENSEGMQIPNEKGSLSPIDSYDRKTLALKLPKSLRGSNVQYFGVWSPTQGMITSVTFPEDMRLPPSLKSIP